MRVCVIYGVPDISCVVLSYKSEYFCLCQKTIVTCCRNKKQHPNVECRLSVDIGLTNIRILKYSLVSSFDAGRVF